MTPNFALSLSFEGIALLRRMGQNWARIQEVPLDSSDLEAEVIALRDKAESLDPKGAQVALIIPGEQIRYMTLPDPGGDSVTREVAARAALDGATPYAVDELSFDISVSDGQMMVAAVANDTLGEAEGFARAHGFTPVSHVAANSETEFSGSVYFGKASGWRRATGRLPNVIKVVAADEAALTPVAALLPDPEPAPAAPSAQNKQTFETHHEGETSLAAIFNDELPDAEINPAPKPTASAPSEPEPQPAVDQEASVPQQDSQQDEDPAESAAPPAPEEATADTPPANYQQAQVSTEVPEKSADQPHALDEHETNPHGVSASIQSDAERASDAVQDPRVEVTPAPAPDQPQLALDLGESPAISDTEQGEEDGLTPRQRRMARREEKRRATREAQARANAAKASDTVPPQKTEDPAPSQTPDKTTPAPVQAASDEPGDGGLADDVPSGASSDDKGPRPRKTPPPVSKPAPKSDTTTDTSEAVEKAPTFASNRLRAPSRDAADPQTPTARPDPLAITPSGAGGGTAKRAPRITPVVPDAAIKAPVAPKVAPVSQPDVPAKPVKAPDVAAAPATPKAPDAKSSPAETATAPPATEPATQAPAAGSSLGSALAGATLAGAAQALGKASRLVSKKRAAKPTAETAPTGAADPASQSQAPAPAPIKDAVAPVSKDAPVVSNPDTAAPSDTKPGASLDTGSGSKPLNALARLAQLRKTAKETAPSEAKPQTALPANPTPEKPAKPPKAKRAKLDEADQLTVFGARKTQKRVGGKPRFLGLMLTALLLLFLVGVAAWATAFMDEGLASLFSRKTEVAETAQPETTPSETETPPAATADPAEAASEETVIAALDTAPTTPVATPATLPVPVEPRELDPEEAAATYAATGIWQRAPVPPNATTPEKIDDPYIASIDPRVRQLDAVALPSPAGQSRQPAIPDPGLPPSADQRFDFDQRGLVRATPEGTVTPDGVRIFLGRPPVIPPLRNAQPTALIQPDAPVQTDINPLALLRPEPRPTDLIEQRERASLGGISLEELARLRPVVRPKTAQETAAEERPDAPATDRAVAQSLPPVTRPRNMAAIVRRAEKAQEAAPVRTASAAAVAPRTVRPSGSVGASVSRNATVKNAINLSKVALIGVYGTPSNRRALVRLPNGKYKKVRAGDRLDGGKVQKIDESALRYTKGGRSVTLKMPRG